MQTFSVSRDNRGRLRAQVSEDLAISMQILPVTDKRRMEKGVQAFAVLDINTSLGVIRVRNIRIVYQESWEPNYRVRWYGHLVREHVKEIRRGDYLDVAGPLDPPTRHRFAEIILSLFHFIMREAQAGNPFPETHVQEEAGA